MGKRGKLERRNGPGAVFEWVHAEGGGCGEEGDGEQGTKCPR